MSKMFVVACYLLNMSLQKCGLESDFKDQYTYLRKFLMAACESAELQDIARLSSNCDFATK